MTREDRLMPDDLAAIRERAERVRQSGSIVGGMIARDIVREDISKLLAEIERLRTALEEINRAWYENSTDYDLAMKVRTILDRSGFRKGE